jgi:alpha-glucosidase
MLRTLSTWTGLLMSLAGLAQAEVPAAPRPLTVSSPDKTITLTFALHDGIPTYRVERAGQPVIETSRLGFRLLRGPVLDGGFMLAASQTDSVDQTWTQVWGEDQEIRDQHNELQVELKEAAGAARRLTVLFRVFNDGLGFRYVIPAQPGFAELEIDDELTEFVLPDDHKAWWIPGLRPNRYEYHYRCTPLTELKKVHTPLTLETKDGLCLSFHEAALLDYPATTLVRTGGYTLKTDLIPWSDGVRVRGPAPLTTPWRTIQIADKPGGLIESHLILNLNEPCKLTDTSWIEPGKFVGVWWEMHIGKSTWNSGPKHGATTANVKRYIDFAAQHGIGGVLAEGWNEGWDGDWIRNGDKFSFTTPYPDFDLAALVKYAAEHNVHLVGHHETGGDVENYERQAEAAFALCQKLGIRTVKTGYVSYEVGIPRALDGVRGTEYHHGQFMVRHFQKIVELAAKYHIMLDVHEPVKDTGERRTWPNMMTREGACGTEYDAWGGHERNPPEHTTILPFTRLLSGPMDYTPGIFNLTGYPNGNRVSTTLAKQLALYVVLYSPIQMAADLTENYAAKPAPFQFIKDVPTDWAMTKVLDACIGDYVTIVRRDRHSADWYLGSITDEQPRDQEIALSFLDPQQSYTAEVYRDDNAADWDKNPYAIVIERQPVTAQTKLSLHLAPGGGAAIRFRAAATGQRSDASGK